MTQRENHKQYCSVCGGRLIRIPKPAEKLSVPNYCGGYIMYLPLGKRFNEETGERQFGILVQCENKKWWNNCDKWVDENSLHDSDLPELINHS